MAEVRLIGVPHLNCDTFDWTHEHSYRMGYFENDPVWCKRELHLRGTVEIWIDCAALEKLVQRAALNKGKQSKDGPLTVIVTKLKETQLSQTITPSEAKGKTLTRRPKDPLPSPMRG